MTVASPRQVLGPHSLRSRAERPAWWDADQIGKPLTGPQAEWVRRGMLHKMPGVIQRALARRGLLLDVDLNDTSATRWTVEGQRVRALLGAEPTTTASFTCVWCKRQHDGRLRATADRFQRCMSCAVNEPVAPEGAR